MYKKFFDSGIILLLSGAVYFHALGAAGDLDVSFNVIGTPQGVQYIAIPRPMDSVLGDRSMLIQSDGKIVLADSLCGTLAIERLNSNGALDDSFGVGGCAVAYNLNYSNAIGYALAQQSDGKIVVAGSAQIGGVDQFVVARFTLQGALDTTFGDSNSGMKAIEIGTFAHASSVVVLSDGKIIVGGYATVGASSDVAVVRLNADGSVDTDFGTAGIATFTLAESVTMYSMYVQIDGKIVLGGGYNTGTMVLVRVNANGQALDTGFGTGGTGIVTIPLITFAQIYSLVLQPDDKIVACGVYDGGIIVARLTADAQALDVDFAPDNSGIVSLLAEEGAQANSVALQPDGKIVVGGYEPAGEGDFQYLTIRLDEAGLLDTGFGGTGIVAGPFGKGHSIALEAGGNIVVSGLSIAYQSVGLVVGIRTVIRRLGSDGQPHVPFDELYSLSLQQDGKIVVAGYTDNGTLGQFAVARMDADGTLDTSFNVTGTQTVALGTESGARAVVVQLNGRVVLAGYAIIDGVSQCAFARLKTNGAVDNQFGVGGIVTVALGTNAVMNALGIQADGKIVGAGYATIDGVRVFVVIRLTQDGLLDSSFGHGGIATAAIGTDAFANGLAFQTDDKIIAVGYANDEGLGQFAVARFWGVTAGPNLSLTAWLKTVYAEELGYAPGNSVTAFS